MRDGPGPEKGSRPVARLCLAVCGPVSPRRLRGKDGPERGPSLRVLGCPARYYGLGNKRASRPDLASSATAASPGTILAGAVPAVLASLLAVLLPFLVARLALLLPVLVTLRLPLLLALLAFILVFLEGAARPAIPVAVAPAAAVMAAIPASAAALTAVPATFAAAPLSSLAHGRSFR